MKFASDYEEMERAEYRTQETENRRKGFVIDYFLYPPSQAQVYY